MGTKERLAEHLRISVAELADYLEERKALPDTAFHAALDIVAAGRQRPS